MIERHADRMLIKDDSDLFDLIERLTVEQPPKQALDLESVIVGDRLVLSTPPGVVMPANVREIEVNLPGIRVIVSLGLVAA
jgi:hypothetical protein